MIMIKEFALLLFLIFFTAGCYGTITGTVVDAETGKPMEGAVVLVEWTKTKGMGLTYTESYKVIEVVTDKDGKATISGVFNPLVDPPDVTVYKKGYVAWNNQYIFPTYKKRKDFKWQNDYVVRLERLERFKKFGFEEHESFIYGAAHPERETEKKKLFIKEYNEWEKEEVIKERAKRGKFGEDVN